MSVPPFLSRPASRAFSLTEIIVATAILSILFVLALPAVQNWQTRAESTKCASNLRRFGQATLLYTADNGGRLPGAAYLAVNRQLTVTRNVATLIKDYLTMEPDKTCRLLICPSAEKYYKGKVDAIHYRRMSQLPSEDGSPFDPFAYYSSRYGPSGEPMVVTAVATRSGLGLSRIPIFYDTDQLTKTMEGPPQPVHQGSRNYFFLDGHMENRVGANPFAEDKILLD